MERWTAKRACKVLGVPEGADAEAVQKAWRRRALETHPDRAGAKSQKKFIQAREAYEFLQGRSSGCEPPVSSDGGDASAPLEDEPIEVGSWLCVLELELDGAVVDGEHRAQVVVIDDEVLIAVYLDLGSSSPASSSRVGVVLRQGLGLPVRFERDVVSRSFHRKRLEALWFSPLEARVRLDGSDASVPRSVRGQAPSGGGAASSPRRSLWEEVLYGARATRG